MDPDVINRNSIQGSLWNRWDLHFHTPSSFEYRNKSVTNKQIISQLLKEQIKVVAITDHHVINVDRIKQLQKLGGEEITILPGIELRDEHGGEAIHYICIFSEESDLEDIWTTFQGKLGLTQKNIVEKGGDEKVYVPIGQAAPLTRQLGGVISIHAGAKSNSIESISNSEQFQRRLKYDITKEYVDLLEIGQLKDIDSHLNIIFPATGLDNPLIICSDNHDINDYQIKVPLWLKADPTFRGLLMVLHEPQSRVFIGDQPEQFRRIEQNSTKYIKSITIRCKGDAPESEGWFDNTIILNSDLVAIIGNKGSGKSALADTLGLLGSTKNWEWFSFLSDRRFCHLTAGHADHYEATLEWTSGEKTTRCLADKIRPEEVERIKYLPQDHVERICNEIVGIGEERFEKELESVIFSHVPEVQRLGNRTFDKLVQFKTGEKQNRIDSIIKQLQEVCRERAALELEDDPKVKRELTEKIKQRRIELEAHDKIKPEEVPNPSLKIGEDEAGSNLLKSLQTKEEVKKKIIDGIEKTKEILRNSERHLAISNRLIEKIENFKKDFDAFKNSLEEEATEVGLKAEDLITFSSNLQPIQKIKEEAMNTIKTKNALLNDVEPPGLIKQLENIEGEIAELHSKLDAPNRAYQAYLKELEDWQLRRSSIVGTEADPDSLNGLQSTLASLDNLPSNISELKDQQVEFALQILAEKLAQVSVFRELYGPVQSFIDSHALVKDKLKLEFRAELTNDGFSDRLLGLLALNRRGSFMGIDEGRDRSEELVKRTNWDEADSIKVFLGKVDDALHQDLREKPPIRTQLKDQTLQRNHPAEIFSLLYGLEYIRPKYVLRWEGKDLSMLSPGERGTLLLVFYLLVEKGDMPIMIDQPEGNLDNYTVSQILVDCIKAARIRRQVFIVTHNPNLAVVCDADQVIHADMDKTAGNVITYTTGALENPAMTDYVTDVLEGTRWAFNKRGAKYTAVKEK